MPISNRFALIDITSIWKFWQFQVFLHGNIQKLFKLGVFPPSFLSTVFPMLTFAVVVVDLIIIGNLITKESALIMPELKWDCLWTFNVRYVGRNIRVNKILANFLLNFENKPCNTIHTSQSFLWELNKILFQSS